MTEAKTLVDRKSNEWAVLLEGELGTSSTPKLLSRTATKEGLQRYYPYLDFDEIEMVTVEVNIKDE